MDFVFKVPFLKNKFVEVDISFDNEDDDFNYRLSYASKGDHAGTRLFVTAKKFMFFCAFYDNRHWDYDNDCFFTYNDDESESHDEVTQFVGQKDFDPPPVNFEEDCSSRGSKGIKN